MLSGALLNVMDARYGATVADAALFIIAFALRISAYPWLRQVPAPQAERGSERFRRGVAGGSVARSAKGCLTRRLRGADRPLACTGLSRPRMAKLAYATLAIRGRRSPRYGRTPVCSNAILSAAYAFTMPPVTESEPKRPMRVAPRLRDLLIRVPGRPTA